MDELTFYIEGVMIEKNVEDGFGFFDSAKMGDKVRYTRSNFKIMDEMTWLVFDILSEVINITATFAIVCAYNIWIGMATVILFIPYMVYNKMHIEKKLKIEKEQIRDTGKKTIITGFFRQ